MTTLDDMYGDLDEFDSSNSATIIKNDNNNNQKAIQANTEKLKNYLGTCQDVVGAAYNVRAHVPDLSNPEHAEFWKEQVIPYLKKCVIQDVQARQVLIHVMKDAFGAVRDLGIVIHNVSEIVRVTRASAKAIEIAKKSIPAAMQRLDEFIEKTENLDFSSMKTFMDQTEKLFDIIGHDAGNFAKQKSDVWEELSGRYDDLNKIWNEYSEMKGDITRYLFLISETERQLSGAQTADLETKQRMLRLDRLVRECDENIQNIDSGLKGKVTETNRRFGWWQIKTVTTYQPGENITRENDKKHYESLKISRKARLCDEQNVDKANARNLKELLESLADYKKKITLAEKTIEGFKDTFEEKSAPLRKEMKLLHEQLDEIDKRQKTTETKFGSSGSSLLECLLRLNEFSQKIEKCTSAYSLLVVILKGIKAMVADSVNIFEGTKNDIFIGANRLTKIVGFISRYSVSQDVTVLCDEYRQLSIEENENENEVQEN